MEEQRTGRVSPHFKPDTSARVLIDQGWHHATDQEPARQPIAAQCGRAGLGREGVGMPILITSRRINGAFV
jgi:hypothetical protein